MKVSAKKTLAGLAAAGSSASRPCQQPLPSGLRGTIETVEPNAIMVKTQDGKSERVALAEDAKVSWLFPPASTRSMKAPSSARHEGSEPDDRSGGRAVSRKRCAARARGNIPGTRSPTALPGAPGEERHDQRHRQGRTTGSAAHPKVKSAMTNGNGEDRCRG